MDWSFLRDPQQRVDWIDRLHYIPIGGSATRFLSINGQIRERGEYQDHPAFGAQPADNGYLLQRYLLSGVEPASNGFLSVASGFSIVFSSSSVRSVKPLAYHAMISSP